MEEKLIYTRNEAAKAACISLPMLDLWLRRADFPALKAGNKWLIPRAAFINWLERQAGYANEDDRGK